MKSTAQQARERRLAEEQEQEQERKNRADAKLKELEAKRQEKAKEEAAEKAKLVPEKAKPKSDDRDWRARDPAAAAAGEPVVKIMERPRDQSRFNLWVDPDAAAKAPPTSKKDGPKSGRDNSAGRDGSQPRGFDTASKFKTDDRDWRARDSAQPAQPAQGFTLAVRQQAEEKQASKASKKKEDKQEDVSKQNRRDKEQKKREQAASLIDIPKPLPPGTSAPLEAKPGVDPKDPSTTSPSDGMPNLEWPVKKMRKFCEEHLVPVTRTDSADIILSKIEQSIRDNGGMLRQKGQKKKVTETPKPRPSGEAKPEVSKKDEKEEDRKERRREREEKGRERRKKEREEKAAGDGDSVKDNSVKEKKDKKEDKKGEDKDTKKKDDDKTKADDKAKPGVPTLESQGLQPIADGLLVGMGVAVAQGEIMADHSGFTTVETHDKNQRKEEQKKREAQREKELRDERRREKEEQRRREKNAKIPTPAPAPMAKPEASPAGSMKALPEALSMLGDDLDMGMHDAPRPHSIQDLNQQAVPKVAWGSSDDRHPAPKKPVSLLQVQVEEKFNKRLDPQFDVELEPQRQGSSSAIGSGRTPDAPASDPWAASAPPAGADGFGSAFQTAIGAQSVVLPNDSFNALQGLNMLQIRPSTVPPPPAPQPFASGNTATTTQPRFQALGLAMLGGADPFASAFGAPAGGMDGWSSAPGGGTPASNPFAAPGTAPASRSFGAPEGAQPANATAPGWTQPRNSAVGHQRAVGGKRGGGGGGAVVAPGPSSTQALGEGAAHGHDHRQKGHDRRGKGNGGPGAVGMPAGDNNSSSGGKGQKHKNGGGDKGGNKRGERRGRGPKEGGDNSAPTATPRPAGADNGKPSSDRGNNNRRGPRRGGGAKGGGGKNDGAAPIATPAPMAPQRAD